MAEAESITSAIVTTVRKPDRYFGWWCKYHLRYVTNIYIYVDADRLPHPNIPKIPGVVVFEGAPLDPDKPNSPVAVTERQEENCKSAIAHAFNQGHQWLVHIDSDELLYSPDWQHPKLFKDIDGDRFGLSLWKVRAGVVTLTNHEALLVDKYVRGNYFLNPYFKNSNHPKCPTFLAYGNGKSAVRVIEGAQPLGVHDFWIVGSKTKRKNINNPCVLHFPHATYQVWVSKYKMLGNFSNYWDEYGREKVELEFHLASRDVVQSCLQSGDFTAAKSFYAENVMSLEKAESLLGKGIEKIKII